MSEFSRYVALTWVVPRLGKKVYVRHVHTVECSAINAPPRLDATLAPGGRFEVESLGDIQPCWRPVLCGGCIDTQGQDGHEPSRAPAVEGQLA